MKINFIVSGIFKSGGMRIICDYANMLTEKAHDVILYYPLIPYNPYNGKLGLSLNLKKNYWDLKYSIVSNKKNLKIFFEHNFKISMVPVTNNFFVRDADATIATIWHSSYSVNSLDKRKGKKFYFIQDYEIWNSDINIVNNSYKLPLTRITISSYLKELLKSKFNSDSEVVLNGIDFKRFNNPDKNYSRKEKNILFIDYLLEKKNAGVCIEVIKILKQKYPDLKFSCFGLKKFHDLPDYVTFIENPGDTKIVELYSNADIFLFTSKYEGFGLPPAEAMACKCAVVTSPVGAIPEFSKDKESAVFIDPENKQDIADAISNLIENEEKHRQISENGFKSVTSLLNWNTSSKKFENILKNS